MENKNNEQIFFIFAEGQIQPPSAISLLGIKLAKKTSLGVLNLSVFRGRLFNKVITSTTC